MKRKKRSQALPAETHTYDNKSKLFVKNVVSFTMTFEQGQSYSGPGIHHQELSCQNKLSVCQEFTHPAGTGQRPNVGSQPACSDLIGTEKNENKSDNESV